MKKLRTIRTCAGIGDSIWLFQKLINQKEKFHWKIPAGLPQRGKQVFDLLPQLASSCEYSPEVTGYNIVKDRNAGKGNFKDITAQDFYLEANAHLEAGRRIEAFLPDLATSFVLPYKTTKENQQKAAELVTAGIRNVGIYCSAYSNARQWGMWRENEWIEFCQLLKKEWPDINFILFGADYDIDLTHKIQSAIRCEMIISHPLGEVVELMKCLDYFVGFPSGLSILNESLGKNGIMFYPAHQIGLMNSWADPARIESGQYKAAQLCAPKKLFDWIKENKML